MLYNKFFFNFLCGNCTKNAIILIVKYHYIFDYLQNEPALLKRRLFFINSSHSFKIKKYYITIFICIALIIFLQILYIFLH